MFAAAFFKNIVSFHCLNLNWKWRKQPEPYANCYPYLHNFAHKIIKWRDVCRNPTCRSDDACHSRSHGSSLLRSTRVRFEVGKVRGGDHDRHGFTWEEFKGSEISSTQIKKSYHASWLVTWCDARAQSDSHTPRKINHSCKRCDDSRAKCYMMLHVIAMLLVITTTCIIDNTLCKSVW